MSYLTLGEFVINPDAVVAVGKPFVAANTGCVVHMMNGLVVELMDDEPEHIAARIEAAQSPPAMDRFVVVNDAIARRIKLGQDPVEAQAQVLETLNAANGDTP